MSVSNHNRSILVGFSPALTNLMPRSIARFIKDHKLDVAKPESEDGMPNVCASLRYDPPDDKAADEADKERTEKLKGVGFILFVAYCYPSKRLLFTFYNVATKEFVHMATQNLPLAVNIDRFLSGDYMPPSLKDNSYSVRFLYRKYLDLDRLVAGDKRLWHAFAEDCKWEPTCDWWRGYLDGVVGFKMPELEQKPTIEPEQKDEVAAPAVASSSESVNE